MALALPIGQDVVELPPMPVWERMAEETLGLGLSPHWHPLGLLRQRLPSPIRPTADTQHLRDGLAQTGGAARHHGDSRADGEPASAVAADAAQESDGHD